MTMTMMKFYGAALVYHYRRCLCVVVSRAGLFTDDGLDFWGRIDDGLNLGQDCMYSVCGVDLQVLVIAR